MNSRAPLIALLLLPIEAPLAAPQASQGVFDSLRSVWGRSYCNLRANPQGRPNWQANEVAWPEPGTLPLRGAIVVRPASEGPTPVPELELAPPGAAPIPLEVIARAGPHGHSTLLVRPTSALAAGTTYSLQTTDHQAPPDVPPRRLEPEATPGRLLRSAQWTGTDVATPEPRWVDGPSWEAANRCSVWGRMLGDCPDRLHRISVRVHSPASLFHLHFGGDQPADFLLVAGGKTEEKVLSVDDACPLSDCGAFSLGRGHRYWLTVAAIDSSGKEYLAPDGPLSVDGFRSGHDDN